MLKKMLQLISDCFWANLVGKSIAVLSILASLSGYTLKEIFSDYQIQVFNKINWGDTLFVGLLVAIFRVLYVCAKVLNENEFSQSALYTPAKLIKHIREMIVITNDYITHDRTQENCLVELCNKLRDCVNKLTNSSCCVSIKLIEDENDGSFEMSLNDLYSKKVHNIARDNNHGSRDSEEYRTKDHYIRENTAYVTIVAKLLKSKPLFYRCNDVNLNNDYITSSPYEEGIIPYKSELVFAILNKQQERLVLKGFLCIDSDKKDAFGKDSLYIDLSYIIADNLYNVL